LFDELIVPIELMRMRRMIEKLGEDRYGKLWYVLIEKNPGQCSFFVFPQENLNKEIHSHAHHIAHALVYCQAGQTAELRDINHIRRRQFENRGIGQLLLARVEYWAFTNGIKKLEGFLSQNDKGHFDKLEHFYLRRGWSFKLLLDSDPKPERHSYAIGIVEKKLGL
jgi:hypothetical protein